LIANLPQLHVFYKYICQIIFHQIRDSWQVIFLAVGCGVWTYLGSAVGVVIASPGVVIANEIANVVVVFHLLIAPYQIGVVALIKNHIVVKSFVVATTVVVFYQAAIFVGLFPLAVIANALALALVLVFQKFVLVALVQNVKDFNFFYFFGLSNFDFVNQNQNEFIVWSNIYKLLFIL